MRKLKSREVKQFAWLTQQKRAGEDLNPRGLAPESARDPGHCCLSVSLWWSLFQVEPMEHTKKLLYQYEAMMQLKNEEKLSKHQAWESELEVGSPGRAGRWQGQRGS